MTSLFSPHTHWPSTTLLSRYLIALSIQVIHSFAYSDTVRTHCSNHFSSSLSLFIVYFTPVVFTSLRRIFPHTLLRTSDVHTSRYISMNLYHHELILARHGSFLYCVELGLRALGIKVNYPPWQRCRPWAKRELTLFYFTNLRSKVSYALSTYAFVLEGDSRLSGRSGGQA